MDFILDVLTKERICSLIECKNREIVPLAKLTTSYNHIIAKGAGISGEKMSILGQAPRRHSVTPTSSLPHTPRAEKSTRQGSAVLSVPPNIVMPSSSYIRNSNSGLLFLF